MKRTVYLSNLYILRRTRPKQKTQINAVSKNHKSETVLWKGTFEYGIYGNFTDIPRKLGKEYKQSWTSHYNKNLLTN